MTPTDKEQIERAIAEGYPHSSAIRMAQGLRLYRQRFRDLALFALLPPFIGSLLTLIGLGSIGTLLLMFVIIPLSNAGLYWAAHELFEGRAWNFKRFFEVLPKSTALIANNILSSLILALVLVPTVLMLQRIGFLDWYQEALLTPETPPEPPMMNGTQSMTFLLNLVPLVYLQVGFSWAFPLIIFKGANALNALEYSRRLVTRRWGAQGMMLLSFTSIFLLGVIFLGPVVALSPGLGNILSFALFLIFPWVYCSLYVAFRAALTPSERD